MPYVLISTQIRLECGPTICGDEKSDPELMEYLGAKLTQQVGNNFSEYRTDHSPRVVLDMLEHRGYMVVGQCGTGQTVSWTLNKTLPEPNAWDPSVAADKESKCYGGGPVNYTYYLKEYRAPDMPRVILNKLEAWGYKLLGTTGIGQTMVWTMYKPGIPA